MKGIVAGVEVMSGVTKRAVWVKINGRRDLTEWKDELGIKEVGK